ncbi:MAG: hypothetical protein RL748_3711 [Pseudomonadota bacterium]
MVDPLLACLLELCRYYRRPCSKQALCAGLPLIDGRLSPALVPRAARRAGLAAQMQSLTLAQIDPALLPVLLLLQENQAALLLGWDAQDQARLLFPESGAGEVLLSRAQLQARFAGIAIFCRPHYQDAQYLPNPAARRHMAGHWLWRALLEQRRLFADILCAALLINLFALALPLYTMNIYDRVVPNFAEESLWVLSSGVLLVILFDAALRLLRNHFIDLASARLDVRLSSQVMQNILALPLARRPDSVGSFAANLRSLDMVREFVTASSLAALVDLPFALLFLCVLGLIAWPLLVLVLLAWVVLLAYGFWLRARMDRLSAATLDAQALRNGRLIETLANLEALQAQGGQGQMQAQWEHASTRLAQLNTRLRGLSSASLQGVLSLQQLVNVGVIICGVYLIHQHKLSLGGLIASTMLAGRALGPLGQMLGWLLQWANVNHALHSLQGLMSQAPAPGRVAPTPPLQGAISVRNLHFTYPGSSQPSLRGVNLEIRAGEKVVIIGRVGSGKSTLQKCLLGLYPPASGSILFDGIEQAQIAPADLRRQIGYVDQDTRLLAGTLRENINPDQALASDDALWAAARVAGLEEAIKRHPLGWDWPISERGESLSGGQKQAVALARALLRDPPILLLDEPSSALDHGSETQFKQRLAEYAAGKTLIIITHRASLMDLAERVIVLDEGVVVADGTKAEVMAALASGKIARAA